MVRLHVVVDREVVLAVVQPGAPADDLLELDHGIDGPQQDDVAHVPGIDAGRQACDEARKVGPKTRAIAMDLSPAGWDPGMIVACPRGRRLGS